MPQIGKRTVRGFRRPARKHRSPSRAPNRTGSLSNYVQGWKKPARRPHINARPPDKPDVRRQAQMLIAAYRNGKIGEEEFEARVTRLYEMSSPEERQMISSAIMDSEAPAM